MQNDTPGPCPTCGTPMIPHTVHGIELQLCNEHGTWLPGDQLHKIVAQVEQEARDQGSAARRRVRRLIRRRRAEREKASEPGATSLALGALLGGLFS